MKPITLHNPEGGGVLIKDVDTDRIIGKAIPNGSGWSWVPLLRTGSPVTRILRNSRSCSGAVRACARFIEVAESGG